MDYASEDVFTVRPASTDLRMAVIGAR